MCPHFAGTFIVYTLTINNEETHRTTLINIFANEKTIDIRTIANMLHANV